MTKTYSVLIGVSVGLFISFANSYSYAISGYTTSEISLIYIPLLILLVFKLLKLNYSEQDILYSTAIAIGIDITTTLTSGMYITYGFLNYISSRLSLFGLSVSIPPQLFSNKRLLFIDVEAMPTYITLAIASLGGLFIAFALRSHFFDKERLRYPMGTVCAIVTQIFKSTLINKRLFVLLFTTGFALQALYFANQMSIDLTPLVSMFIPAASLTITFVPLVFALFLLLPLGALRMLFIGSFLMYLVFVPLAIALFKIPIIPAQSYDNMLFSVSPIVLSYNVGFVATFLLFYITRYFKQLLVSLKVATGFTVERLTLLIGLVYITLLGVTALLHAGLGNINPIFFVMLALVLLLHFILIIGNIRIVGETGTGSQALYPLVTLIMYSTGLRDPLTYAILDPYTGIPMPQTIAASAINLLRYTRLSKGNSITVAKYFSIGVTLGCIVTYFYGNMLLSVYGINSPQMPLTRWIPTVVWMSAIYSGKLTTASLHVTLFSLAFAVPFALLAHVLGISLFPLLVGITLTPDIGFQALLAYLIKGLIVKFGSALQEKLIIGTTFFLLGAACAIILNTMLNALGLMP
uniref:OPT family oligopeptide transporter n=1 Tax=Ignisphaera aggregans TaxID=334771 RepID=A0A7C4BCF4_9CREN